MKRSRIDGESKSTVIKKQGVVRLLKVERRGVVNFQVVVPGQMGTMPIGYPFASQAEAEPFYARCVKFFEGK